MPQYQGNFTQLTDFDPVLTDLFYSRYSREIGMGGVMQLFNIQTSTKAKETDLRIGGFKDPVPFAGKVVYTDAEADYEVEYSHTEYILGFQITRAMFDDMQYSGIFAQAEELGVSFGRKMRKDAASVFNNAFSSSYLGYDSKALCASDHPRSKSDSTSVSNNYTLALTSDNLETVIVGMQGVKDDIGEEITVMPDVLVVPRALRKTGLEIVGSEFVPENANNAINVNAGMSLIVDPYLTDTNAWFVVDSTMARSYLKWYNRATPEFRSDSDEFNTLMRRYRGYARYSYGWSDFRWIAGSNPS